MVPHELTRARFGNIGDPALGGQASAIGRGGVASHSSSPLWCAARHYTTSLSNSLILKYPPIGVLKLKTHGPKPH